MVDRAGEGEPRDPSAANDPTGSRLTETMKATVSRNFRRASARWTRLSPAR